MPRTQANRPRLHARPQPQPVSPAHDDEWTKHYRSAPQNRDAWPRTPRAKPALSRCCRDRRAAYRTHIYFTGIRRRDVACYVLPTACELLGTEKLQAASLQKKMGAFRAFRTAERGCPHISTST